MSSDHGEKFVTKLLVGFGLVTAAVFLIYFIIFNKLMKNDWYYWGIATAILFNAGLYMLVSAAVHKMKSDMIRRQKTKDQQKTSGPIQNKQYALLSNLVVFQKRYQVFYANQLLAFTSFSTSVFFNA